MLTGGSGVACASDVGMLFWGEGRCASCPFAWNIGSVGSGCPSVTFAFSHGLPHHSWRDLGGNAKPSKATLTTPSKVKLDFSSATPCKLTWCSSSVFSRGAQALKALREQNQGRFCKQIYNDKQTQSVLKYYSGLIWGAIAALQTMTMLLSMAATEKMQIEMQKK